MKIKKEDLDLFNRHHCLSEEQYKKIEKWRRKKKHHDGLSIIFDHGSGIGIGVTVKCGDDKIGYNRI